MDQLRVSARESQEWLNFGSSGSVLNSGSGIKEEIRERFGEDGEMNGFNGVVMGI